MELTSIDIIIIASFIGICLGFLAWSAVIVFLAMNALVEYVGIAIEVGLVRPVVRYARFIKENGQFILWKKNKLPDLQERTRHNDREALAERIVKSDHERA